MHSNGLWNCSDSVCTYAIIISTAARKCQSILPPDAFCDTWNVSNFTLPIRPIRPHSHHPGYLQRLNLTALYPSSIFQTSSAAIDHITHTLQHLTLHASNAHAAWDLRHVCPVNGSLACIKCTCCLRSMANVSSQWESCPASQAAHCTGRNDDNRRIRDRLTTAMDAPRTARDVSSVTTIDSITAFSSSIITRTSREYIIPSQ